MISAPKHRAEVNPYSRWIYDHPSHLLAEPTPEFLAEKRAQADALPVNQPSPQAGEPPRLMVELGSGSGNFLLQLGQLWPQDHLVGFELRYKRLVKSAQKLERAGLNRVWLLREQAERFPRYFTPGSVDRVYLNFPDPWPKRHQWKKRLVHPPFLEGLEQALQPGGRFLLKTDHSGYFLHCIAQFEGRKGWKIVGFSNDLHRCTLTEPYPRTEFEQLFTSRRKVIYHLAMQWQGNRT